MKKTISALTIASLLFASAIPVFSQQGNWEAVRAMRGKEAAIKTRAGDTVYGAVRSVDDDRVEFELADKRGLTGATRSIARQEISRVWNAQLRYGGRNVGKGALIGLGAGAAVGTAVFVPYAREDAQAGAVIPLAMVYGAGIGAVIGFFSKKSHRKRGLVYST